MGNTGADFHKAFESSCSTYIYILCCVKIAPLSLTHSMCFMAQPRIRIWRKKRKKRAEHKKQRKIFTRSREKRRRSNDGAGTHRWTRTFGSVGWRKRDSRVSRSWNQCAPNSLGDRSFFVCASCELLSFYSLFSRWTRFFMLHRARGEWRDLNSHARWRQIDSFFFRVNNSLLLSVVEQRVSW